MLPVEESTPESKALVVATAPQAKLVCTAVPGPISVGGQDQTDAGMSGAAKRTSALVPLFTEMISGVPKLGLELKLMGTVDAAAISRSVEKGGTTNCGMVASCVTSRGSVPVVCVMLASDSVASWFSRGSTG